jgi:hypothetical protein
MRGCSASTIARSTIAPTAIAIVAVVSTISLVRAEEVFTLDVRPVCRGIAAQSADPGVGQGGQTETFQRCVESEQQVREDLKKAWPNFSAADKRHCVDLARTGGESSYTELLTCLEMARDVRQMRAAAAGNAAADLTKPPSSPPTPAAPPATAAKETPKTSGDSATTEVDKAKAEAQAAKASQALAEKKLADVEAALAHAKEDAKRAATEAEQAKAATQAAKESEASVKRKLADVEAARAAAEQACSAQSRPGFMGRVRGWLRRPATKTH